MDMIFFSPSIFHLFFKLADRLSITQQCFALLPQMNFPADNLNLHERWRWRDQIQAIFLNFFYFTRLEKRKFMIFGSFQKQKRKMMTAWMEKNHAFLFWQFFRWQRKYLFKICQSDTSNKVLTPISPNFYTLQTWNDNSNMKTRQK